MLVIEQLGNAVETSKQTFFSKSERKYTLLEQNGKCLKVFRKNLEQNINWDHRYENVLEYLEWFLYDYLITNSKSDSPYFKALHQLIHLINHLEKDDSITVELLLDMFLLKALLSHCDNSTSKEELITIAYEISSQIKTLPYSPSIQSLNLRVNIQSAIENFDWTKILLYDFSEVNCNDCVFYFAGEKDLNMFFDYCTHYLIGAEKILVLDL